MAKIERYGQGAPSWFDLMTTDQSAAKEFYADLFGWDYEDVPMAEQDGQFYSIASVGGANVAAISTQPSEHAEQGIPPCWNVYLTVDDVDATVADVPRRGGSVVAPPFDVMKAGRMAVIKDPTSAVVALWQAGAHIGAEIREQHGAISWVELLTDDPPAVARFFSDLLGVKTETMHMQGVDYTVFTSGDGLIGGGTTLLPAELRDKQIPPHWNTYFHVDDVDAAVARATARGAQTPMAAMDIPTVGRVAFVIDPQGAGVGLRTPA